jgi:hypothetical protein
VMKFRVANGTSLVQALTLTSSNLTVGNTGSALATIEGRATSGAQLAASYDASDSCLIAVGSTGNTSITLAGTTPALNLVASGGVQVNSGNALKGLLSATASLSFGAIANGATATQTITVTGAAAGNDATASPAASIGGGFVWSAYVSGSNTVTVIVANLSGSTTTPSTQTWRAVVRQF